MILSGRSSRGTAFIVAAIGSIIASCIFILLYVTGKPTKKLTQVELNFAYVWGVFYLVVSGLVIATMVSNYVTAGVSNSFSLYIITVQLILSSKHAQVFHICLGIKT